MRTEEVNKKVIHYIADDGKDFGEDKEACLLYEFKNPYVEKIAKIPKIENVLFFHNRITGYWCESQEDIDICCKYFQECKRKDNLTTEKRNEELNYSDCVCSGRFIYPGYYFIIKFNSGILNSYVMYSKPQLENLWEVFLNQIPLNPKTQKKLEEIEKIIDEQHENYENNEVNLNNNLQKEEITPQKIFQKIKEEKETREEIDIKDDTKNQNIIKNIPKIYTKENLKEYKLEKDSDINE